MPIGVKHPGKFAAVTIAAPSSYTQGGSDMTLTSVRRIASCIGVYSSGTARVYHVKSITTPNVVNVVAMTLVNGAASTQVANGTDISADTLTFIVELAE